MNRNASDLIGDLLIQIDRLSLYYHPSAEYRKITVQKFLSLGCTLTMENANSKKWKDAYGEAQKLWEEIVNRLPYVGYSTTEGSRKIHGL
jgi:hypothetical protein